MANFFTSSVICAGLFCSASALAQNALITPDWSGEMASRYLAERRTASAFSDNTTTFKSSLRLPALGLRAGFAAAPVQVQNGFVDPAHAPKQNWWPACASSIGGAPKTAADEKGTWYSAVYDYKCITITVSGDLNSSQSVPKALREELSDSNKESVSVVDDADENGKAGKAYLVTYDVIRFNVPYSITIECTEEALSFCKDRDAQKHLLARLSIVAGAPEQ